jgi:rsbT antagonist protein RsbS
VARVHIVQVGSVLIATLGDELDDDSALSFQDELGGRVVARRATGVLIDISALDIVDSFICKVLGDTAQIVRVLGADVVLAGMRPAVAITMVELGLGLDDVTTARNVDAGLAVLASTPPPAPGGRSGRTGRAE